MNGSWIRGGLLAVAMAGLAGCATPGTRIEQHQALFDSFPPAAQAQVRQGQVEPGFTMPMVYLALGKPNREYVRQTLSGQTRVWSYTDYYTSPDSQLVEGTFRIRDSLKGSHTVTDKIRVDVDRYHEYERKRIEFRDGQVSAIETVLNLEAREVDVNLGAPRQESPAGSSPAPEPWVDPNPKPMPTAAAPTPTAVAVQPQPQATPTATPTRKAIPMRVDANRLIDSDDYNQPVSK